MNVTISISTFKIGSGRAEEIVLPDCRPPSIVTAPNLGKILSEPSKPAERKTNRLKRKDLRIACVNKSQVFVCYSVSKGYAVVVARTIMLI